ncbi:hypothetical protein [Ferrimonas aestuarii]|uniref:Uncharacterized protein n=1 Tax=Ferrimonas aestuarii TaxID=2569539 RepID=A0A4V5NWN5_9GAMM|nr:hypothetical protein [Ferrimonas aestuarii]TKB57262.1 hypothetical protein FCL42_02990 [Ferrimonas aestuarii]
MYLRILALLILGFGFLSHPASAANLFECESCSDTDIRLKSKTLFSRADIGTYDLVFIDTMNRRFTEVTVTIQPSELDFSPSKNNNPYSTIVSAAIKPRNMQLQQDFNSIIDEIKEIPDLVDGKVRIPATGPYKNVYDSLIDDTGFQVYITDHLNRLESVKQQLTEVQMIGNILASNAQITLDGLLVSVSTKVLDSVKVVVEFSDGTTRAVQLKAGLLGKDLYIEYYPTQYAWDINKQIIPRSKIQARNYQGNISAGSYGSFSSWMTMLGLTMGGGGGGNSHCEFTFECDENHCESVARCL